MNLKKYLAVATLCLSNLFGSSITTEAKHDSSNVILADRIEIYNEDKRVDLAYGTPSQKALDKLVKENELIASHNFEIVQPPKEKLVIAPDLGTYIFEISKWSKDKKWPIFLKENKHIDDFIAKYNPSSIDTIESLNGEMIVNEHNVYGALFSAQNKGHLFNNYNVSFMDHFNNCDKKGIVLTKIKDPCFAGAFALAAYHNQWLDFMGNFLVKHDANIGSFIADKLQDRILDRVRVFDYKGMGNLDYLTIGLDFAYKFKGKWEFGDASYSLDNLLARDKDGSKWAYHGRLIDRIDGEFKGGRALYQAMSSLFLEPSNCLMFDTYWDGWDGYKADMAHDKLSSVIPTRLVSRPASSPENWKKLMGVDQMYDLLFVQSRGNPDYFNSGKTEGMGVTGDSASYVIFTNDIPKSVPSTVLFTHSYSAANPYDPNTIAGKFIQSGAVHYFGSISEPFVDSYNQPSHVVNKMLLGKTLGEATQDRSLAKGNRYHDSDSTGSKTWRNIFIGNPMKRWNIKRTKK